MFRPWVATLLLSVSVCEQRRMAAGLLPLDARLAKDAEGRGIKAEGLETLESQFRALADVPEPDQVEMLKSSVRFYDRIDDMMETMIQLYLQRELGAIWPLQMVLAEKVGVARRMPSTRPSRACSSRATSECGTRPLKYWSRAMFSWPWEDCTCQAGRVWSPCFARRDTL